MIYGKKLINSKAIIYWYDSALKGHLSFCDEQCNKIQNVKQLQLKMENVASHRNGFSLSNKPKRIKLSDDMSTMSLPERNMHN